MSEADCDSRLHAIVVGDGADGVVRTAGQALRARGVAYSLCADVYHAAGRLAGNGAQVVLVVGRLDALGREDGRFFEIVRRRGHICCCVADGSGGCEAGLMEALRGGTAAEPAVSVCGEGSVRDAVDQMVVRSRRLFSIRRLRAGGPLVSEFTASRAEMEALFGLWVDDTQGR